jgi:UDP-N-acetylmuramate dehydrogenase
MPPRIGVALSSYTRFGLGGPADHFLETSDEAEFVAALRETPPPVLVLGGGTNLIVSDSGFRGAVLRYTGHAIWSRGGEVHAQAGADLQDLVDHALDHALQGLETLAGIPGWVGGAVYGNAGAYGHSISERVRGVRFFDGARVRDLDNTQCEFRYRASIFQRRKDWIILSVELALEPGDYVGLRKIAGDILKVRNEKFPPSMKCAGSIFKNLLAAALPPDLLARVPDGVIREGKVPAAFFLEQVGAKSLSTGGIHVAGYHANLIYNDGAGTAAQLCELIDELKDRVRRAFGLALEEEVQYVGFPDRGAGF